MKKEIANRLIYIGVGFIICLLLTTKCNKKNGVSTVSPSDKVVTTVDTLYLPSKDIKGVSVPKTKLVPYKVLVHTRDTIYTQAAIDSVLAQRTYQDTIEHSKGFSYTYKAVTTGTLDTLEIGSIDTRPQTIVKQTTTITKYPKGVYVGIGLDGGLNPSANINWVDKRQIIGVDYAPFTGLANPSAIEIRYSRKISFK